MRSLAVILLVFLGTVFIGGYIPLGKATIFEHLDALLGTDLLMNTHYAVFFFLYKKDSVMRSNTKLKEFQQKPLGIDHRQKYKQLDEVGKD